MACAADRNCCGFLICIAGTCAMPLPPGASAPWRLSTRLGSRGSGAGEFYFSTGAAISPDQLTLYVADQNNHRISIWSRPDAGSAWTPLERLGNGRGSGAAEFSGPTAVTVSEDQLRLYISDSGNHRISIWSRSNPGANWNPLVRLGGVSAGSGPGQFNFPVGASVTADQLTIYVADQNNNRISVWSRPSASSTDWSPLTRFGFAGTYDAQFRSPHWVVVAPDQRTLYVADTDNNRISIWSRPSTSAGWTPLVRFGIKGGTANSFSFPTGLAISPDQLKLYVADSWNNRISVWSRPSTASTAWAPLERFGKPDTGTADMSFPTGLALAPDQLTAYVAEMQGNRVSIWTRA
jgi:DNA-binding beta-propeller fold protein YncE